MLKQFSDHIFELWQKASHALRRKIIFILAVLFMSNAIIVLVGLYVSDFHPVLFGLLILAYGLGLRHAVDADHIAAIDNTTRKLLSDGQRPVTVGLFFSLGHATIVIFLSLLAAFSSAYVRNLLPFIRTTGSIIETLISCGFLLLIGLINFMTFLDLFRVFHAVKNKNRKIAPGDTIHIHGLLTRLFKPLLKTITKSWHMYFVGFLFGLGFDTASEVALLSISAASGISALSFNEIVLIPLAFTGGMSLIDTIDGILMLGAYGWAYIKPIRKLYYNLTITFISVFIAFFIGGIEALQLLSSQLKLQGAVFRHINQQNLGKLGYIIIAIFLLSWLISIGIYKMKQYDRLAE